MRQSVLLKGDAHLTHYYDDARTLYEFFLRGARVSSKSQITSVFLVLGLLDLHVQLQLS